MKKTVGLGILGLFALFVGVLSSWGTYRVSDRAQVGLMWNHQEAYLFCSVLRRGYRMTYLGYLFGYVKAYFYAGPPADDTASYTELVLATPSTVQKYVAENKAFDFYAPIDNTIYASDHGYFWKWSGDHFEKAGKEDQDILQSTSKQDFTDVNGWSRRRSLTGRSPYSDIKIQIDGGPITVSTTASDREVSVDISTQSSPPQRVFDLDQRLNRVSKTEYEKIFAKL